MKLNCFKKDSGCWKTNYILKSKINASLLLDQVCQFLLYFSLQYPVRPSSMSYDHTPHLATRMKPKQQKVDIRDELFFELMIIFIWNNKIVCLSAAYSLKIWTEVLSPVLNIILTLFVDSNYWSVCKPFKS